MAEVAGLGAIARVLKIRDYRNYMVGNFFSQLGMWVQRMAVGWLTWELTGDPKWLGIVVFADFFPNVIMAPLAGALADRMDRLRAIRLYMVISATLSAAIAGLTITNIITIEMLLVLVLANGTAMAFNYPVRLSIIYSLVGRGVLTSAVSVNALAFNIARICGPAVAGIMISIWGIGPAVSFTVIADLVFVFMLYRVTLRGEKKNKESRPISEIPREIMAGFRYAANHPGIGRLLIILTLIAILGRPFVDLFPGFADRVFNQGVGGLAWLTSTLGVGSLAGALVLTRYSGVVGLTRLLIASIMFLSIAVVGFAATKIFWVALCSTALAGFAVVLLGVTGQVLLQSSVDSAMRGRVLSLYTLIARGCPSFGALLMGYAASFVGLQLPVAIGAILCIGLWMWAKRNEGIMTRSLEASPDEDHN